MTAEMDVYAGEVSSPKDLSNGHANVGGSYVFVNGNDDPVDSDLNSLSSKRSNTNLANVESSHVKENLLTQTDLDREDQEPQAHAQFHNAHHQVSDSAPCPVEADTIPVTVTHPSPATHETEQPFHTQEGVLDSAVVSDLSCSVDSHNVDVETSQRVPVAPVSMINAPTERDIVLDDVETEKESEKSDMAGKKTSDGHSVDDKVENGPLINDIISIFPCNGASSETETGLDSSELGGEVSSSGSGDSTLKSIVSDEVTECIDGQTISVDYGALESGFIGKEGRLPTFPGTDVKMGSELENKSVVSCGDIPCDDGSVSESDILRGSVISSQSAQNCGVIQFTYGDIDGGGAGKTEENEEVKFTSGGSDDKTCQEAEGKTCQEAEVQFTDGEDKTCQEGEIQFTAGNDNKTGQDEEEDGEIQFFTGKEENRLEETEGKIQFAGGKTCGEEEEKVEIVEESDDKISQKLEEDSVEIQFTGEDTNGTTCQKIEDTSKMCGEIPFTGEASDGKTCQEEGEQNGEAEIQEGEENRGCEVQEGKESKEGKIQEGDENEEVKIEEGEENGEGETHFTEIEDNGEIPSDRTPRKVGDNEETLLIDGEKDNKTLQLKGGEGGGKACQEVEGIDGIHRVDETRLSAPEGSTLDASETLNSGAESEMQNAGSEVVKRPFYFLIKVPRYDDENLREQIKCAQLKVDEKTKSRDVIRAEIQMLRDIYKKYGDNLEAAMSEEKAARELLKSKRQEIDSLQSMINKVKNAISIEDIDGRIRNMEHMIAHETLPLKEEKQFIREIKQLRQLREQFSSSMGKQDEVQQAFDQKDQIEERLKLLRKEVDSLRENVLKAEVTTQNAKKKQKDESEKLKKLYTQFKVADDDRQEAYKHLQSLRKQANDKNKYFWKYKDDLKQANDLVSKGDKEALQHLCVNQVERVLELWNNNNEFREQYVNCNIRSTLRRLKTLDGRSLGPDEVPSIIPTVSYNRVARDTSVVHVSTLKEEKNEQVVPLKSETVDDKPIPTSGERKNQTAKSRRPAKLVHSANGSATVSGRYEIEEARDEESKLTKEEEELARKAEELRKEEEAAKLKEQRRLEEKIKAKEALERKKRIAEKAQARAALRAQKEAEEKEKEREKRARKKEKRKAAESGDSDLLNERESAPSMETAQETSQSSEVREKSTTVAKRPQKSSQFTKQTQAKSIPLPLRSRGKRRMQTWMWVLLAALLGVALFLLGNSSFPVNFGLRGLGF